MKLTLNSTAIALATLVAQPAWADTFELDPTHTYASFKIDHLERGNLTGVFKDVTGMVKVDGKDQPSVDVTISVASLDTFNAKRDEHLLGPDFFNAKRYGKMRFKSAKVKKLSAHKYEITGSLEIKGKKKTIKAVLVRGKTGLDPWGGHRTGGNVTLKINRKDFGVGKKEFDAPVIGNTVDVDLYWEALRK